MGKQVYPVIFGVSSLELNKEEIDFFTKFPPLGFILFARNIDNPEQVIKLNKKLREIAGFYCPILIDQEGGRVARLKPPHFPTFPTMQFFEEIAKSSQAEAKDKLYSNNKKISEELNKLEINVDCAPVCDLRFDGAHNIIGDRSFGSDVELVAQMCRISAQAFLDNDIIPIIKHIPGHGRAKVDSHEDLPIVDAKLEDLQRTDFAVFKSLANMPVAMTAHIIFNVLDEENPVTLSRKAISFIRNEIGFRNLIMTDDLSMKALKGSFSERATKSLEAGCDILLHCNGKMDEMKEVVANLNLLDVKKFNKILKVE